MGVKSLISAPMLLFRGFPKFLVISLELIEFLRVSYLHLYWV